jgi:hypothetical protein
MFLPSCRNGRQRRVELKSDPRDFPRLLRLCEIERSEKQKQEQPKRSIHSRALSPQWICHKGEPMKISILSPEKPLSVAIRLQELYQI